MESIDDSKVIVLYSKYDALSLQRIVGTNRTPELINSTDTLHTLSFEWIYLKETMHQVNAN